MEAKRIFWKILRWNNFCNGTLILIKNIHRIVIRLKLVRIVFSSEVAILFTSGFKHEVQR